MQRFSGQGIHLCRVKILSQLNQANMKDNQNNHRNQDKPANLASQKQTGDDSHKKTEMSDKVKGSKEPVSKQEDQQRLNSISNQSKKVSDTPDTDEPQNDTIKEKAAGTKNTGEKHKTK